MTLSVLRRLHDGVGFLLLILPEYEKRINLIAL